METLEPEPPSLWSVCSAGGTKGAYVHPGSQASHAAVYCSVLAPEDGNRGESEHTASRLMTSPILGVPVTP